MSRTVGIGIQDFEELRENNLFYIDKTLFIKEWWENMDSVTLLTRPRRFGKTLTMRTVEEFFSVDYKDRGDLFEGLAIWEYEKFRKLQGTYPVIFLSFANIKEKSYEGARNKICRLIQILYRKNEFLLKSDILSEDEKADFSRVAVNMPDYEASLSLQLLSNYLFRYYKKKVIILLDEYDTPMQEAYVDGYWDELAAFTRSLFNATFKENAYLARGIMTGITRVSKEFIFSDLNNLEVVTTTSEKYKDSFGFTEEEVFAALDEYNLSGKKQEVKFWYDGFTFGTRTEIYNPWSILNFLEKKRLGAYWANTSSNSLVSKLVREGSKDIKQDFELLMRGECLHVLLDEQVVYNQLSENQTAVWSLLVASGYLKVQKMEFAENTGRWHYYLALTNREVRMMFEDMIHNWFGGSSNCYNDFIKALLLDDLKAMNVYMNKVALTTFSYFDTGKQPSEVQEPERFYHGFVLGLLVDLQERYAVISNRESGFGRYDVILEPKNQSDDAIVLEFKVQDPDEENDLSDTVRSALGQIERKKYVASLIGRGISEKRIRRYGFAFQGKKVLIGK